ncbi:Reelin [Tupaia chinensis]|uniref:Reelin n=1 Tax=Tupaia chinensis TaxID=246437 RepID=L9LAI5_TUPCH|nr:Reelin [Tupaia chinensis]
MAVAFQAVCTYPGQGQGGENNAEIHSDSIILRDDFDSYHQQELNPNIWVECNNCETGEQCGAIMHGNAVTFCEPYGPRELITTGLNTTTASVLQFSIGSGSCRFSYSDPSIIVSYAKNNSADWIQLEKIRAPSNVSTIIHILYLPEDAKGENVQFQWKQENLRVGEVYEACWALDNILVINSAHRQVILEDSLDPVDTGNWLFFPGATVKHSCQSDGNSIYFHGNEGSEFNFATTRDVDLSTEDIQEQWSEEFESQPTGWDIFGAVIGTECGTIESGLSMVFLKDGERKLCTPYMDTTGYGNLRFYFVMGGICDPGDSHENDIILYAKVEGRKEHIALDTLSYSSYKGEDVWAIDEIIMTSVLFNSISLDFTNLVEVTQSLGFYLGNVQPYCGHDWTLCFTGDSKLASSMRYVETQSMQIGASYMIQFSLVMGCGQKYTPHMDNQVKLEYSTNHGLTWHLVQEECLPSMPSCQEFTSASIYHASEFTQWRRVIVLLPQKTWSSATRFRWSQSYYTAQDEWALDSIYIGQQCPNMCNGHGSCDHGMCRCDQGYQGTECHPEAALPSTIMSDFENQNGWESDWQEVIGGEIVKPEQGCGVISSGSSLYFNKAGKRQLVSWDLDTSWVDFVQFYIQIGGESAACNKPDSREEGVLLQYSNNGGIQWHLLAEMYFSDFSKPRFVYLELPAAAKTPCTRFRWWQPVFSGEDYDQWAVDDIIILSEKQKQIIPVVNPTLPQNFYEKPAFDYPMNQMSVWLMLANEGMVKNETFCAATPSAMVFGKSDGDRFAVTRDLTLKPGYVLQFKLNIGCANQFSSTAPVLLQYSHDAGMSWFLVKEGCYPASAGKGCEGNSRELSEPTMYHTGDFEEWTRITVIIPRSLASSKTRFRWIQESNSQKNVPPFGLDGVYISEPCPSYCSGHGDCISGVCFCDLGYTAAQGTCVSSVPNFNEMFDRFEGKLSPLWYKISGGQVGTGCGTLNDGRSLYFNGPGKREARTVPLDTRNIRLVQFYIQIGSKTSGITCIKPRARNEGLVVQYSNDNGILWHLLRELDFTSFLEPQIISIDLPREAKTPATSFRWWQPQHGKHSAQWALDDVLIGMNDSSQTGFQDKFDGSIDLQANWYRIQGGQVDIDCLSMDTALIFTENIGKPRYAETWDFHVSASTFLQFEMSMGCSKPFSNLHSVQLQYSLNNGRDWHLVTEECVPPTIGCLHYTESSIYTSERFQNWKRITVYLPLSTISPRTRFRWIQANYTAGADTWAIDNVVLASGCPWMCSGRGICDAGRCVCDRGFGGSYCVPVVPLPSILKDDFNGNLHPDLWPEVYGKKEEIWIVDDFIIDGNNLNNPVMLLDTFDFGPREDNWFFYPGGNIGLYCPYSSKGAPEEDSAMVFVSNEVGEHSITTRDLNVNENTIIQFEINVGCSTDSSSADPVRLEFSRDFGATWHLLLPLCYHSSSHVSSLCSTEHHPSSTYYAGTTQGWRREVVHFGKLHLCGSVRFRWYQGFYPAGSQPVTWAIDNVYIGPQCEEMCNGHGSCINGTKCICDPGYSGPTCKISTKNPDFLKDDFEGQLESDRFLLMSGGKPSRKCGILSSGNNLFFNEEGLRMLMTRDLDLSHASNSSNVGRYIALEIPLKARSVSTRLRWWQPSENGHFYSPWVIDQILIGGNISGNTVLEDDFTTLDSRKWLLHPGGTKMPVCGSTGDALVFIEKASTRYVVTTDIAVNEDSFLQIDFAASCSVTDSCYAIELEYSIDLGLSWHPLIRDCLPTNVECSRYHLQRILVSDTFNKWTRITLPLPPYTRSQATRFRWHQPAPFDKQQTWAIDNVYIGDGCIDMCSGHGRCIQGNCVCDELWGGLYCDEPETSLPTQLKDNFNRAPSAQNWLTVNGGKLSTVCGAVASGMALHFSGGCSRLLVTVDLNLTNAEFIQFYFMYGCLITPNNRNQGVLLEYSVNGGITWNLLMEIFYDQYSKPGFVNILLPPDAKEMATRFRWWQPRHDGLDQNDWAIDNVLISGSADQRTVMLDTFSSAPVPQHERSPADAGPVGRIAFDMFMEDKTTVNEHWLFHDECTIERFCDSPDGVMICGSHDGREVYAVTHDLTPTEGWIMQFKISVGCKVSEKIAQNQIHVQYSTDFGVSWNYLVPQCLPADPKCSGSVSQPSVFFPTKGWKRITYPLPESLVGNPVRFRFYQKYSDTQWAIDNFYLGPGCLDNCRGHGDCLKEQCICDPGYSGPNCYLTHTLKTFLKERFDSEEIKPDLWMSLEGGSTCTECGILAENTALYFGGSTVRQAITQDLDLRGAKFLQYWGRIGSESNMTSCHRPICRKEGVLLDYSTDGGITWTLLHEMDFQKYISVRHDYILLPEDALTNTTRLRWWQPFVISAGIVVSGVERAQWALDNILIGGAEINPSQLVDTFDDEGTSHEENWSFYPNAVRTAGFCGNPSFHLYWPNKKKDKTHNALSSRELIIQPGYMMQFKFHEATIYNVVNSSSWKRITIQLPDHVSSSATQFRWIQKGEETEKQSWAIDHVYIGEACPKLCSGHGYCTTGAICICDENFQGDDCSVFSHDLPSYIKDNFESARVTEANWETIQGGVIGSGCGQLAPYAHGDSLYFNGCQIRQAATKPLDLTRASKIMFVLQIGSTAQTDSCNSDLSGPHAVDKAVLLQYSVNNGITWHVIAQHQPKDFTQAQRVSYNVPLEARMKGVLLRWWQPRHNGTGHDQWALDHVEVVLSGLPYERNNALKKKSSILVKVQSGPGYYAQLQTPTLATDAQGILRLMTWLQPEQRSCDFRFLLTTPST